MPVFTTPEPISVTIELSMGDARIMASDRTDSFLAIYANHTTASSPTGNGLSETFVDGTSFSAPIVTSVVAQMLEANPRLKPSDVKRILLQTAKRLPNLEVDRQGWGAVQPKAAVARALEWGK